MPPKQTTTRGAKRSPPPIDVPLSQLPPSKKTKADQESSDKPSSSDAGPQTSTPSHIMANATRLPQVKSFGISMRSLTEVKTVDMHKLFVANAPLVDRLLRIATATLSNLLNPALADPSHFRINAGSYITANADTSSAGHFFLVGIATHSELRVAGRPRQLCVAGSGLTWPRTVALFGKVKNQRKLAFPVFRDGVSYSSYNRSPKSSSSAAGPSLSGLSPSSPIKNRTKAKPSITLYSPVRAFDDDVPVYDGRDRFKFETYHQLPNLAGEVDRGAAVVVTFSISSYDFTGAERLNGLNKTTSMNIQDVILLADPAPSNAGHETTDGGAAADDSKPLGVLSDTESDVVADQTVDDGDDGVFF